MSNSALFSVLNQVEVGSSKFARADYMNAGYPGAFNKKSGGNLPYRCGRNHISGPISNSNCYSHYQSTGNNYKIVKIQINPAGMITLNTTKIMLFRFYFRPRNISYFL